MNNLEQISFDDTATAFASKSTKALKKIHWLFAAMNSGFLVTIGTFMIESALKLGLPIEGLIKSTLFKQFCGGENIEESEATIEALAAYNIGTILDYAVEGEKTEAGFNKTTDEIIKTIEKAKGTADIPFCVFKMTGLASGTILAKKQKGVFNEEEAQSYEEIVNRVERICKTAYENKVRIFIDGEESWMQDTIDELAYAMMKKYNKEQPI